MKMITISSQPVAYFDMPDEEFPDVAVTISSMTFVGNDPLWPLGACMQVERPSRDQKQAWEQDGKPKLAFIVECNAAPRIESSAFQPVAHPRG